MPLAIIFEVCFIDANPFSKTPFTAIISYLNLFRLFLKILFPFLTMFTYNVTFYCLLITKGII